MMNREDFHEGSTGAPLRRDIFYKCSTIRLYAIIEILVSTIAKSKWLGRRTKCVNPYLDRGYANSCYILERFGKISKQRTRIGISYGLNSNGI